MVTSKLFSLTFAVPKDGLASNQTATASEDGDTSGLMELSVTRTPGVSASKPIACTQPAPTKFVMVLFRITRPEFTLLPSPLNSGLVIRNNPDRQSTRLNSSH